MQTARTDGLELSGVVKRLEVDDPSPRFVCVSHELLLECGCDAVVVKPVVVMLWL